MELFVQIKCDKAEQLKKKIRKKLKSYELPLEPTIIKLKQPDRLNCTFMIIAYGFAGSRLKKSIFKFEQLENKIEIYGKTPNDYLNNLRRDWNLLKDDLKDIGCSIFKRKNRIKFEIKFERIQLLGAQLGKISYKSWLKKKGTLGSFLSLVLGTPIVLHFEGSSILNIIIATTFLASIWFILTYSWHRWEKKLEIIET